MAQSLGDTSKGELDEEWQDANTILEVNSTKSLRMMSKIGEVLRYQQGSSSNFTKMTLGNANKCNQSKTLTYFSACSEFWHQFFIRNLLLNCDLYILVTDLTINIAIVGKMVRKHEQPVDIILLWSKKLMRKMLKHVDLKRQNIIHIYHCQFSP